MRHYNDGTGVARHMRGYKRDRKLQAGRDCLLTLNAAMAAKLARKGDVLPIADQIPIYDQGGIGSCTANMGGFQFEFLLVKHGAAPFKPSRLDLYKAVRRLEGTPLSEDSGAECRDIMRALRKVGVCREDLDPYVDDGVAFTLPITEAQAEDALEHQAVFYYRCASLHAVKYSIAQGFPVGFGFTVFASFMSSLTAGTGLCLYPDPNEEEVGGHAVTVVGYDDDKVVGGEVGALLVRNSWGEGWGLKGNFWLPYRYVDEGIAGDFWTLRLVEEPGQ